MTKPIPIDRAYLLDKLKKMIAIDSVLPHEGQLARFLATEVRALGIEPILKEITPGRPNLYADVRLGPSPLFLVFSGHSDTVPPAEAWESDPFEPIEKDGHLYGLGAINMKGGLACSLAAFKALIDNKSLHPNLGRLGFAVTVDQEGHSIGAEALLDSEYGRCDAMMHAEHFYGDSEVDYLPMAVTGKVLYRVSVEGRAGHAFRPEEGGINAVTDAARIVAALDRLKLGEDVCLGRGTVCVLKIDGGYKTYSIVVPERCEVVITRLTVPGENRETAVKDLHDLINSLNLRSKVTIEIPPPFYDPYRLEEDTPILEPFRTVYEEVIGTPPVFAGHRGVVDANIFAARGKIPTIVFGPKGARHHEPGEYVEIATLEPVARIYAETAIRFFAGS